MEILIIIVIIYSIFQKLTEKSRKSREAANDSKSNQIPVEVKSKPTGEVSKQELEADPFKMIEDLFFPDRNKQQEDAVKQHEEYNSVSYDYEDSAYNYEHSNYDHGNRYEQTPKYNSTIADNNKLFGDEIGTLSIAELGKTAGKNKEVVKHFESKLGQKMDVEAIRQGVIWGEVLGAPKSKLSWRNIRRSRNVI